MPADSNISVSRLVTLFPETLPLAAVVESDAFTAADRDALREALPWGTIFHLSNVFHALAHGTVTEGGLAPLLRLTRGTGASGCGHPGGQRLGSVRGVSRPRVRILRTLGMSLLEMAAQVSGLRLQASNVTRLRTVIGDADLGTFVALLNRLCGERARTMARQGIARDDTPSERRPIKRNAARFASSQGRSTARRPDRP